MRILLVEDSIVDTMILLKTLYLSGINVGETDLAGTLAEGLPLLEEKSYDLILLDLNLPDSQEMATLEAFLAVAPEIPIVVVTVTEDESFSLEIMRTGAQDYLVKGLYDRSLLKRVLHYAVERKHKEKEIVQAKKEAQNRSRELSRHVAALEKEIERRRFAESELQLSKERLSFLVSSCPTVIYTRACSEPWSFCFLSDNVLSLTGHGSNDFLANAGLWPNLALPEDQVGFYDSLRTLGKDATESYEYRFRHALGHEIWIQDVHRSIVGPKGRMIVGALDNVTRRRQAQDELLAHRKHLADLVKERTRELELSNRALEQFAVIASHDLQEPLRKIQSFADLMLEDYHDDLDEEGRENLQIMCDASKRMHKLIKDLLDLSRLRPSGAPFDKIDLGEVLDIVLKDLDLSIKEIKGIINSDTLPMLQADPLHMRQLFLNLIGNALKYRHPDRRLQIDIRVWPVDDELRQYWLIEVSDNGIGFEQEYGEEIFQPFRRLHSRKTYPGTGIGLAICEKIVELHRGTIEASGSPDKGACFRVCLPFRQ